MVVVNRKTFSLLQRIKAGKNSGMFLTGLQERYIQDRVGCCSSHIKGFNCLMQQR